MSEKLNRRAILAGAAALPTLTVPAAAAEPAKATVPNTAAHPDAVLLELGRRLTIAWAAQHTANAKWQLSGCEDSADIAREFDASFKTTSAIVHKIRARTAKTIDGLRVKAAAISWCQGDEEAIFEEAVTTDLQIAESIVHDLLAMQAQS